MMAMNAMMMVFVSTSLTALFSVQAVQLKPTKSSRRLLWRPELMAMALLIRRLISQQVVMSLIHASHC